MAIVQRTTYEEANLEFTSIDELQSALRERNYIAERGLATSPYLALKLARPMQCRNLSGKFS